jgi:rRNA maturation endonuclease Nob1
MTKGASYKQKCIFCGEPFRVFVFDGKEPTKICAACDTPLARLRRAKEKERKDQ